MFIEKKKQKKGVKYYLAHSYREKGKSKKIRKYLGINLSKGDLVNKREKAKEKINELLNELNTEIFGFALTPRQINSLNNINNRIRIVKLSKKEFKKFTQDFAYNTNAIEGSKLLENEVKQVLEEHPKTKDSDEIEAMGVEEAIKFIIAEKKDLSLFLIRNLHKLCFKNSKHFAGKFRDVEVVIKNPRGEIIHRGIPVKYLDSALKNLIEWYEKNKDKFKPIVLAGIIHNQFEYIHPVQDGNGRVGRLLLNFILLRNNYPPINIFLEDRQEYYYMLEQYQKNQDLRPTMEFLVKQYHKTLKETTKKEKSRNVVPFPKR